jgi:DNA-binding LacI/PurR family transcriptional regulator
MYHGIRRIRESHRLRLAGFCRIARRAGAPVKTVCVPRDLNGGAVAAAEEVRRSGTDGFFGADSVLSVNCLLACRRAGLDVGTGVRVVGVNCSQWQAADYPKITSIDISWRKVGRMAIEKLVGLVEADALSFPTIAVKPSIVTGGTCPVQIIS